MARVALVEKEKVKQKTVDAYRAKREEVLLELKKLYLDPETTLDDLLRLNFKLQSFPRKSIPTRLRARCSITGRPRGVYRKVGLSRGMFRKLAMSGQIPGIVKSSW